MFRAVLLPGFLILLCSTALGLSWNALRSRDRIEIGRAYFQSTTTRDGEVPGANGTALDPTPAPEESALAKRASAEFRVFDVREARAVFDETMRSPGDALFIDARDDAHYREGHVPGALQLDYYNLQADIEPVLECLRQWQWLIVYCESDECEDGFLLCRSLRDVYGFPAERILLFVGGMREWRARGFPVAMGGGA